MYFVRHALHLYVALIVLTAVVFCASPVGKVSSAEPFQLRGAQVPVAGVSSWPVMNGDEIGAMTTLATIQFRDGSRIVLAKGSKARVEEKDGKTVLRLFEGAGAYSLAAKPEVTFFLKDKAAVLESGPKGVISVGAAGRTVTTALISGPPPPPPPPTSSR